MFYRFFPETSHPKRQSLYVDFPVSCVGATKDTAVQFNGVCGSINKKVLNRWQLGRGVAIEAQNARDIFRCSELLCCFVGPFGAVEIHLFWSVKADSYLLHPPTMHR